MLIQEERLLGRWGLMRILRCRWLVLVLLVLAGSSCVDDGDFPDEGDVPQESLVVMPGAEMVESSFNRGQRTRNVDGGVRDYATTQTVVYEIDGVTGRDVYEWYLDELSDQGWEFYATDGSGFVERGGEPGQCRIGGGGYCGNFKFLGPEGPDDGIGVIHSMRLTLLYGVREDGGRAGVEHIDDEIDGFRITIFVGFAPSESCEDWDGPAWGVCAN